MSNLEINLKNCKAILAETEKLTGKIVSEGISSLVYNDVLVLRDLESGAACVGFMAGPDWIDCYEFDNNGNFNHYEPMTRENMAWALYVPEEKLCDPEKKL